MTTPALTEAQKQEERLAGADIPGSIEEFVQNYEFRGDSDYTPTAAERVMLVDAITGFIGASAVLSLSPTGTGEEIEQTINAIVDDNRRFGFDWSDSREGLRVVLNEHIRALLSRIEAAGGVKALVGWQIVPLVPTREMMDAFWRAMPIGKQPSPVDIFCAMLAAAPLPSPEPKP